MHSRLPFRPPFISLISPKWTYLRGSLFGSHLGSSLSHLVRILPFAAVWHNSANLKTVPIYRTICTGRIFGERKSWRSYSGDHTMRRFCETILYETDLWDHTMRRFYETQLVTHTALAVSGTASHRIPVDTSNGGNRVCTGIIQTVNSHCIIHSHQSAGWIQCGDSLQNSMVQNSELLWQSYKIDDVLYSDAGFHQAAFVRIQSPHSVATCASNLQYANQFCGRR